ncbi:TPA: hypothetical protein ACH3X3_005060 [Trebouxia sp. C0006]
MVFKDRDARRRLNSATHLPVALELVRQLAVEWLSLTSVAVERLMKRDACSKPQAEAKVKAQMRLKLKKDRSQIVIDNSGDKHHCEQQVQQLVRQLQGKYKWLGVATSPVVFVGVVWLLLRVLRLSSA